MQRKEFRKLIGINEARNIINRLPVSPRIETIPLEDAVSRVLADNIIASIDVPPFDRASMDGYALHAEDIYAAREDKPVQLQLVGSIPAGVLSSLTVNRGEAVEVSTGALMPKGADAVIMVEHTSVKGGKVLVRKAASINENITQAGADIMIGERVLREGTCLTSREVGVLAALGIRYVKVKAMHVGIISTGNELSEPGRPLGQGKIYDTNTYSLAAGVKECSAQPILYGISRDNEEEMGKLLDRALEECDLVLTSGSTSAGAGDIIYRIIKEKGELFIHGINVKPGKPVVVGLIKGKPVIGLPGYPVSALTIFSELVAPLIRSKMGIKSQRTRIKARLAMDMRSEARHQYLPVGLVRNLAYPIEKESGAITALVEADGFLEISPETEVLEAGEEVEVTLFGDIETPDILFIGSHCLGVDILSDLIQNRGRTMRVISAGSTGGFNAVRNNIADIAGVHLLDESGVYNAPFLKKLSIEDAVLIKGYLREQGLMVRRDSNITCLEDILDKPIINRNTGSGTRMLLDLKLREVAARQDISFEEIIKSIKGYDTQAKTHSAVASAVKLGRADAGAGIRPVAELNGLKFIKIADEEYDFLVPKRLLGSSEIKSFLEALLSREFADRLPPGIRVYPRTGEIIYP